MWEGLLARLAAVPAADGGDGRSVDGWKERRHDAYFLLGMFAVIGFLLYGGAEWDWFISPSWFNHR